MPPKILLVDDHDIVRQGIRTIIFDARPEWIVCGEAADGLGAIDAVSRLKPDIVVLDITMPSMSGLEAASRINKLGLNCAILIFTMHESEMLVNDIRQTGARGYVQKSQAARDLITAIEALMGGGTFFHPHTAKLSSEKKNDPKPGISFCSSLCFA